MTWAADVPNPGSDAAMDRGCWCAVLDNHHGKGRPGPDGKPEFWITAGCPLHHPPHHASDADVHAALVRLGEIEEGRG